MRVFVVAKPIQFPGMVWPWYWIVGPGGFFIDAGHVQVRPLLSGSYPECELGVAPGGHGYRCALRGACLGSVTCAESIKLGETRVRKNCDSVSI